MNRFVPSSIEEASERVRTATAGEILVATGAQRHLDTAPVPSGATRVDLGSLCRAVEHRPGDMTVTVGSRVGFADLRATLAAAGQFLPLDPPAAGQTTVGGLIAADLSGPLRTSHGRVRDHLLGIEVLDGQGSRLHGGGRVVKNVAGYDTPRLHVGAQGTLGWILEATFKVLPLPRAEAALSLSCASPAEAARHALRLRTLHEPGWMEVAQEGERTELVAGLLGEEADVAAGIVRWRAELPAAQDVADPAQVREKLADRQAPPDHVVVKAALLPTDLPALLEAAERESDLVRAQPTTGIARFVFEDAASVPAFLRQFRPQVEARHGWLTLERAGTRERSIIGEEIEPLGRAPEGYALMEGVRAVLDPNGLFGKGRMGWSN